MNMQERSGATLLEVLVAIFVMGIGLLALLVLFPLGALRMAQAIQDDRCAQACRMANTHADLHGVRNDNYVLNLTSDGVGTSKDIFADPEWAYRPADPDGPSYPVLVDPAGYITSFGILNTQNWVAGMSSGGNTIRRRSISKVAGDPNLAMRWFTLLDDVYFDIDGTARYVNQPTAPWAASNMGSVERDIRYSWAYMLRRPKTSNPSIVDLTVLVFNRRTLALSTSLGLDENLYQVNEVKFDTVRNTITLDPAAGNVLPAARNGDWLLDATYIPDPTNQYGTVNGYFYRVVGQTETVGVNGPSAIEYEVQPELRNFPATDSATALRKIIFMDGLAEVFEKGPGRMP